VRRHAGIRAGLWGVWVEGVERTAIFEKALQLLELRRHRRVEELVTNFHSDARDEARVHLRGQVNLRLARLLRSERGEQVRWRERVRETRCSGVAPHPNQITAHVRRPWPPSRLPPPL